jgi:RNA polymerase sigma-70 factor (ECF subfamily)
MLAVARAYAPEAVDDLFQELALQLWRSLARFDGRCELTTWAYRVHLNTAMSWRRTAARRRKQFPATETLPDQVVDPASPESDIDDRLRLLIATVGETDRAVLLMYLDRCDTQQIAEVMGVSEGAIRVRLHRISKRIGEGEV